MKKEKGVKKRISFFYVSYLFLLQAQRHLLVLARADGLDSIDNVCEKHIPILKNMHAVGLEWAKKFILENKSLSFRLGYHSVSHALNSI